MFRGSARSTARSARALPWLACALALTACVERSGGGIALQARVLIASAEVAADEGGWIRTADPGHPDAAIQLEIPAGALPADQRVSLWLRLGDPRLPQMVRAIEVEPRGLELLAPARITVDYGSVYESVVGSLGEEDRIELFSFVDDPVTDSRHHQLSLHDTDANLIRATTRRFGSFFAVHPELRRLIHRRPALIDPAAPIAATNIDGRFEAVQGGPYQVFVGQGRLADFHAADASQNLVVVHGLGGDAISIGRPSSLAPPDPFAGFNQDFANVVVFEYPSSRSLREAANALYDALAGPATPDFGTRIVAYSAGGLVVRYALELSHLDPTRPGFRADDPPLADFVDRVVYIATPHRGAPAVSLRLGDLLRATEVDDFEFVAGLFDLVPGTGGLIDDLLRQPAIAGPPAFTIAGDVNGLQSDGLVDVSSALGPLSGLTRPDAWQVFSGPSFEHEIMVGQADRGGVIDQCLAWLSDRDREHRPIVGSVLTPETAPMPLVTLQFTVSEPGSDACEVTAEYSLDGLNWRSALDSLGRPLQALLNSAPAPGLTHRLDWNTLASGIPIEGTFPVRVRLLVRDSVSWGITGQSGAFVIAPPSIR